MSITLWQIDAFTDRPFAGNPAAVCLLDQPRSAEWMQQVATEMNLSETAFLANRTDGDLDLRWFTPAVEVDLCGHATLASAHVLWENSLRPQQQILRFHTRSGVLLAEREGEWIRLTLPAKLQQPCPPPSGLIEALGCEAQFVGRNEFDYLVEVASEELVRSLQPDLTSLARIQARGIIVTARADSGSGFDFVSRFFAPAVSVPEDPVTGSAHCCLGPFWSERLGKTELRAYQASRRGGVLGVRVRGAEVDLLGQAVTVLRAELLA